MPFYFERPYDVDAILLMKAGRRTPVGVISYAEAKRLKASLSAALESLDAMWAEKPIGYQSDTKGVSGESGDR